MRVGMPSRRDRETDDKYRTLRRITAKAPALISAVLLLHCAAPAHAADAGKKPDSSGASASGQTSIREFPRNLGRNFLGLFDPENLTPLIIGTVASGGGAFLDHPIQNGWAVKDGSSTMGRVGATIGGAEVVAPTVAGMLILGHYSKNVRFRAFSYAVAQGEVLDVGLVGGLKVAVRRERPDGSDKYSFPSGHAASSFTIAAVATHYYGWRAAIAGYSAAVFIAASRSRENKHWASDLAAGATIGYIVGSSVSRRAGIPLHVKKIAFMPSIDLRHRVIGVTLWRASD